MLTDSRYDTHDTARSARASARPQRGGCYLGARVLRLLARPRRGEPAEDATQEPLTRAQHMTHTHTRTRHTRVLAGTVYFHSQTTTRFEPGILLMVTLSLSATSMTWYFWMS